MRKVKSEEFAPIPQDELAKWNALIKKGKTLVGRHDKAVWELILLVGEIKTSYGDSQIKRFADEIGIHERTAWEYGWMARAGVNKEFIDEWAQHLSFGMVRQIMRRIGRLDAPSAKHFLEYAKERKITIRAMDAYILSTIAPDEYRDRIGEELRLAIKTKQEAEGFDDYIRGQMEKLAEEQPEIVDMLMKHTVVSVDDLDALKVQAGVATDEEVEMAGNAKRQAGRVKRFLSSLKENKVILKEHLAYGHENSDELRLQLEKVKEMLEEILATEQREIVIEDAEEVNVGDYVKS